LGAAGFRLAYQGVTLWIDPYVTRLPLHDLVRRRVVTASEPAIAKWIDAADAVLVGHTHFDHALDVPAIARRFGCPVYGSRSLDHLMRLHGGSAIVVEPYARHEVGPFRFHFVPSVHSKLWLGVTQNYAGELTCDRLDHLTPQAYRCGDVWGIAVEVAGLRFYHLGSADFVEDALRDRGCDVLLCGIAGRRYSPRFVARIVHALAPQRIVACHHDDFFAPIDTPMRFSFNVNLTQFADEVRHASRTLPVHTLEPGCAIG
jgi:L-ascorbate metabolism protein UlaG (beta-lactamase superfamily)